MSISQMDTPDLCENEAGYALLCSIPGAGVAPQCQSVREPQAPNDLRDSRDNFKPSTLMGSAEFIFRAASVLGK